MPSPKTEADRAERTEPSGRLHLPRGWAAVFQRLNTRLVLAIGSVALVGLVVSAIAINQILPGYFAEQTSDRLETAGLGTGLLMRQFATTAIANERPGFVEVAELRAREIVRPAVRVAAQVVLPATYAVFNDPGGQLAAQSEPGNVAGLEAEGLRPDPVP